jgi:hypothetical protein
MLSKSSINKKNQMEYDENEKQIKKNIKKKKDQSKEILS